MSFVLLVASDGAVPVLGRALNGVSTGLPASRGLSAWEEGVGLLDCAADNASEDFSAWKDTFVMPGSSIESTDCRSPLLSAHEASAVAAFGTSTLLCTGSPSLELRESVARNGFSRRGVNFFRIGIGPANLRKGTRAEMLDTDDAGLLATLGVNDTVVGCFSRFDRSVATPDPSAATMPSGCDTVVGGTNVGSGVGVPSLWGRAPYAESAVLAGRSDVLGLLYLALAGC